jgi:DNA polymerase-4
MATRYGSTGSVRLGSERTFVHAREATILHADADAFFASVEQRDDPRLRGRPTLVGSGVVMAASYEARAFGVRGAMGGAQARRLCPHAVIVEPRFPAYVEASRQLFDVFKETAPGVEGLSLEEAFLDVRGLQRISGKPAEIAARLRREVRARVGLPITVGVARTRLLAKMASRQAKPDGLLVVAPERELAFLHPIRVERLWGIGAATASKLHELGCLTIGDVAKLSEEALVAALGPAAGRHLHAVAHNRDVSPVRGRRRRRRSIGSQSALGRKARSPSALDAELLAIVDRVSRRMRESRRRGRTVVLRLRFGDYSRATRSCTLPHATAGTDLILAAARALLAMAGPMIERRGVTLVGVTVANLDDASGGEQLALPVDALDSAALDAAVDDVRRRFGAGAVSRARLLGRRIRPSPWVLSTERSLTEEGEARGAPPGTGD